MGMRRAINARNRLITRHNKAIDKMRATRDKVDEVFGNGETVAQLWLEKGPSINAIEALIDFDLAKNELLEMLSDNGLEMSRVSRRALVHMLRR